MTANMQGIVSTNLCFAKHFVKVALPTRSVVGLPAAWLNVSGSLVAS
jgi:hypothetical protein